MSIRKRSSILSALLLVWFAFVVHAQPPARSMAPGDILRVASVGDAQISPGGERVVYTVTTVDGNASATYERK